MKRQLFLTMAATVVAIVFADCNKEKVKIVEPDAESISIQASIDKMTKVSYNGDASSFTAGDSIIVYGWTGSALEVPAKLVVDGVINTFDGSSWSAKSPMLWNNNTDSHYFVSVFPVLASVADLTAAPYKLDESDYTASDLLVAANLRGVKSTDGTVNLTFGHVMAKLNVNLKFRSEWKTVPEIESLTVSAKDSASVNFLTSGVTAAGPALSVALPKTAAPAAGFDAGFSGLMVPQEGVRSVVITINGQEYVYESPADIALNAGRYTTLELTIGKERIEMNSISIADWTSGQEIKGGEAELIVPKQVDPNSGKIPDMGQGWNLDF